MNCIVRAKKILKHFPGGDISRFPTCFNLLLGLYDMTCQLGGTSGGEP